MARVVGGDRVYYPLLKGKAAEYQALAAANDITRSRLHPLIDVPPIPWDHEEGKPKKTLTQHLEHIPEWLAESWRDSPVLVDLFYVQENDRLDDGFHPMESLARRCKDVGVQIVPVTAPDRPADYQRAVLAAESIMHAGVCLRLGRNSLSRVAEVVRSLAEQLHVTADKCDLIFDLRDVGYDEVPNLSKAVRGALADLPDPTTWRAVVVAGTAFPPTLRKVKGDSVAELPRTDVWLWNGLIARLDDLPRVPYFGDYGVTHPDPMDVDPKKMKMSANLRYTLDEHILIFKGRGVKKFGYDQFRGLCRKLIGSGYFAGPEFSWGDEFIAACAASNMSKCGNATTWLQIGTSHHLEVVATQIAKRLAA